MRHRKMSNEFIINAKVLYFIDVLKRRRQVCDFLGPGDFYKICQTLRKTLLFVDVFVVGVTTAAAAIEKNVDFHRLL